MKSRSEPLCHVNLQKPIVVKSTKVAGAPDADRALPEGRCEFAGDLVDATFESRTCSDATFCPISCYSDSAVFGSCPARKEKLQNTKEQP